MKAQQWKAHEDRKQTHESFVLHCIVCGERLSNKVFVNRHNHIFCSESCAAIEPEQRDIDFQTRMLCAEVLLKYGFSPIFGGK